MQKKDWQQVLNDTMQENLNNFIKSEPSLAMSRVPIKKETLAKELNNSEILKEKYGSKYLLLQKERLATILKNRKVNQTQENLNSLYLEMYFKN